MYPASGRITSEIANPDVTAIVTVTNSAASSEAPRRWPVGRSGGRAGGTAATQAAKACLHRLIPPRNRSSMRVHFVHGRSRPANYRRPDRFTRILQQPNELSDSGGALDRSSTMRSMRRSALSYRNGNQVRIDWFPLWLPFGPAKKPAEIGRPV